MQFLYFRVCLHGVWGPRSGGVGFFCFHAPGDTKQKKPTPLDRGPPRHVNRVLETIGYRRFYSRVRRDASCGRQDDLPRKGAGNQVAFRPGSRNPGLTSIRGIP